MTVLRTSLRNFLAHQGRMLLSTLAVLLSVAFVCGTLVFTDTLNTTFNAMFTDTAADVTVSSKRTSNVDEQARTGRVETIPAASLDTVERTDGVASAIGAVVSTSVGLVDSEQRRVGSSTGAPTIAGNWSEQEKRSMEVTAGHPPRGPDQALLDADTATKHGVTVGDELRVVTVTGDFTTRISGIGTFTVTNPGATLVYFDTETAQRGLLGSTDMYTHLYLAAADGVSDTEVQRRVRDAVGDDYRVLTREESVAESEDNLGFLVIMKYAMLGFAALAFLVGVFLIVNTFSMLVAQRTREIGLMRAIGASRGQVNRSVLVEAVLLGVVGSVLGIGAGVGLAVGLMRLMALLDMNLDLSDLTVRWTTPVLGLLLGVLVTVLAAYLPARRAGRVSPMAALRDETTASTDRRLGRGRIVMGALCTLAGGVALGATAVAEAAVPASVALAVGVLLTLLGLVVIGPLLSGSVVRLLSPAVLRPFGPVGRMAERNALRNPRRTGATGAALMIGLALVAGLSVVGSSLVASASEELDRSVGADFIVQSDLRQPITPQVDRALRSVPGLDHVTAYKNVDQVELTVPGGATARTDLVATSPHYAEDVRIEVVDGALADAYRADGLSVDEDFARRHDLAVGDRVTASFPGGGRATLTLGAITVSDATFDPGAKFLSVATAERYLPADRTPLNARVFAQAEEGEEERAYRALKTALEPYPQYTVRDQADYKKLLEGQVGQLLSMVYGLLALAIIVAVLGVVNTLALSVVERTREIGVLRAIGLSRRQLRRMIRLESVVIALFGALLGLALGMCWGVAGHQLLALEGLRVLAIPWTTIGVVFAGSAVVGLVAAVIPAFRAARMDVLEAIGTQ